MSPEDKKRLKLNETNRNTRRRRKLEYIKYKGSKCCCGCGVVFNPKKDDPSHWGFHHRVPEEKSSRFRDILKWKECDAYPELDKCDLYRSVCHSKEHSGLKHPEVRAKEVRAKDSRNVSIIGISKDFFINLGFSFPVGTQLIITA